MPSVDILHSALRKAKRVSPTKGNLLLYLCTFYFHLIIVVSILVFDSSIYEWKVLLHLVKMLTGIANAAKRERNKGAKQLDALMKVRFSNRLMLLIGGYIYNFDIFIRNIIYIDHSFYIWMQELAVPLRTYKENFPNKKYLHPYERSLIELTLGDGNYEDVSFNHLCLVPNNGCLGKLRSSLTFPTGK